MLFSYMTQNVFFDGLFISQMFSHYVPVQANLAVMHCRWYLDLTTDQTWASCHFPKTVLYSSAAVALSTEVSARRVHPVICAVCRSKPFRWSSQTISISQLSRWCVDRRQHGVKVHWVVRPILLPLNVGGLPFVTDVIGYSMPFLMVWSRRR